MTLNLYLKRLVKFFKDWFTFLHANLIDIPDKLILAIVDISNVGFEVIKNIVGNGIKLFILKIAIFIL